MLAGVRGIAFTRFTSADVVRHPLVQKIINAYERHRAAAADAAAGERRAPEAAEPGADPGRTPERRSARPSPRADPSLTATDPVAAAPAVHARTCTGHPPQDPGEELAPRRRSGAATTGCTPTATAAAS